MFQDIDRAADVPGAAVNSSGKHLVYLIALCSSAVTFIAYLPVLQNVFVNLDDNVYVYENIHIRSVDPAFLRWAFSRFYLSNWHPLTWISYAVDYAVWGLEPFGYHLTNVLMHCLNTFLVVVLAMRLLEAAGIEGRKKGGEGALSGTGMLVASGATGLLFGLHPLHVESVAWVSERKDVLYAAFYLLGLLSYLRYASGERRKGLGAAYTDRNYLLALGMFVLALMSKPMAVTLPLVLLILDWYPLGRAEKSGWWKLLAEKMPFLLLALASGMVAMLAQRGVKAPLSVYPLWTRILMPAQAVAAYLFKTALPLGLSPVYPFADDRDMGIMSFLMHLLPLLIVASITVYAVLFKRRQKLWAATWCFYVVTLLPVLGIVQIGPQMMADRYTYLASLGPFLLTAVGFTRLMGDRSCFGKWKGLAKAGLPAAGALLLLVLSLATVKQIQIWENGRTLWSRVISVYPGTIAAYAGRGGYYMEQGRYAEAAQDFTRGILISERSGVPRHALLSYRARANYELHLSEKAVDDYTEAIRLSPVPVPDYYVGRGLAYKDLGHSREAINDFLRAEAIGNIGRQGAR